MKSFLCVLVAATLGLVNLQAAQKSVEKSSEKQLTAFKTLEQAQRLLGEDGRQVLGMESKYAKFKPLFWWIRIYDPKLFLKVRAVYMIGPEMVRNVEPGNPFDGGNEELVIQQDLLKYDSDKCIRFMERAAKENGIPLYSLNILLEKPYPGESNPIWTFEWFDEKNKSLGIIKVFVHEHNLGYGGNQKTCYREALKLGADIVVMLHPDYQYSPKLVGAMAHMVASGHYDAVLGSRILAQNAVAGGMPVYKYIANRFLTLAQNILMGQKLSEYHTGYRAFSRQVLEKLPLDQNSNDFVFDNQMLCQAIGAGFRIGEISCPTRYFPEASSINFRRSVIYGFGVLKCAIQHARWTRK